MADKLQNHLLDIEKSLGGSGELPPANVDDKLEWHLNKIEDLLEEGGGSGLPDVTEEDNGDVLMVKEGAWDKGQVSGGTKLYRHSVKIKESAESSNYIVIYLITNFDMSIDTFPKLDCFLKFGQWQNTNYRVVTIFIGGNYRTLAKIEQTSYSYDAGRKITVLNETFEGTSVTYLDALSYWSTKTAFIIESDTVTEL